MDDLIGRKLEISGMIIEVLSDEGDSWQCRNLTTRETLVMKKAAIDKAVRLGQAEFVGEP